MSDSKVRNKSAAENSILAALLLSITVFLFYFSDSWISYLAATLTTLFTAAVLLKKYKYYSWISMYSFAIILVNIAMIIYGEFELYLTIPSTIIGAVIAVLAFRLSRY